MQQRQLQRGTRVGLLVRSVRRIPRGEKCGNELRGGHEEVEEGVGSQETIGWLCDGGEVRWGEWEGTKKGVGRDGQRLLHLASLVTGDLKGEEEEDEAMSGGKGKPRPQRPSEAARDGL